MMTNKPTDYSGIEVGQKWEWTDRNGNTFRREITESDGPRMFTCTWSAAEGCWFEDDLRDELKRLHARLVTAPAQADDSDWAQQHMQALRKSVAAMTTKALGDSDLEALPYEVIKALGLEVSDYHGVDVLPAIANLTALLQDAAKAIEEMTVERDELRQELQDAQAGCINCGNVGFVIIEDRKVNCNCAFGKVRTLSVALASVREAAFADAAKICEKVWRESPNDPPQYLQNRNSHGCLACANALRDEAAAIRALRAGGGGHGKND